jgi:hypothetical protein
MFRYPENRCLVYHLNSEAYIQMNFWSSSCLIAAYGSNPNALRWPLLLHSELAPVPRALE